jgi:hypothetical protein
MRYAEPPCSLSTRNWIATVKGGAGQERIETLTVLARYRFDILSDRVE